MNHSLKVCLWAAVVCLVLLGVLSVSPARAVVAGSTSDTSSPSAPAPAPTPSPTPTPTPTPDPMPQPAPGSGVWTNDQLAVVGGTRSAADFAAAVGPVAGVAAGDLLPRAEPEADDVGNLHVRFDQRKNGLLVVGGDFTAHADTAGNLYAVFGDPRASEVLSSTPSITPASATSIAGAARPLDDQVVGAPQLIYFVDGGGALHLAYEVEVSGSEAGSPVDELVYVDGGNGVVLEFHALTHSALYRQVYNGNHTTRIPGPTLARREGAAATGDAIIDGLYNNLGSTYQFYWSFFHRDSFDGHGARMNATAHWGVNYSDANYNNGQIICGDGDVTHTSPLCQAFDLVVHETTHGVTATTAKLNYCNEPGALNEATSDIMASVATAYYQGVSSPAVWKFAEDIWTPSIPGDALRYLDDPARDGRSSDWYPSRVPPASSCNSNNDFGGVHRNSGIANLAFKLMATGGQHPRGRSTVVVGGLGYDAAGRIWYQGLRYYLTSTSTFKQARYAMGRAALDLFGRIPQPGWAVRDAFNAVGVPP